MRGVSAGSRVWVKNDDQVQFGVIKTFAITSDYFSAKGSMVIVMDDGHRVVATTMATRGTVWDLVSDRRKEEPA
jgi:hypothetical protein